MITIGTDCSGIEAPIEALKQLGIPYKHIWSCEKDKYARQSIQANYEPEIFYEDITTRNHTTLPDVDIYVCGFPCQSFSLMGKKLGTSDVRSNIMYHCIDVIKIKKPNIFILENVKNFKFIENGEPFNYLIQQLENISEYNIYHEILNTKDYGIPQNRERIYIIGIKKDIQIDDFTFPKKLPMKPLDEFILDKTIYTENISYKNIIINLQKLHNKTNKLSIVTADNYYSPIINCCPTLTTKCGYFFVNKYNRKLLPKEILLLQGFPITFVQNVSNTQLFKQIGNSMSVNVLKEIFKQIINITLFKELI